MKRITILLIVATLAIACATPAAEQSDTGEEQPEEAIAVSESASSPDELAHTFDPTATPVSSPASQPVDAPTPHISMPTPTTQESSVEVGNIEPYPSAPLCVHHDETRWHGLWNAEEGCHYDHTHNADPFATEFGDRVAAWEQSISYPWQTAHENVMKHQGYKYTYTSDPDCAKRLDKNDNCVKASLIQLHAIGSQMDMTVRFHSYRAIALISEGANDEPGVIELGGHSDFGILHCLYKREHCPLPSDPPNSNFDLMRLHPPYRVSTSLDRLDRDLVGGKIRQGWNSGRQSIVGQFYPTPYNLLFEYDFHSADAWGAINADDLTEVHLMCPAGDCPFNHSTLRVYEIVIRVPEELAGPDGRVNFTGFTDLQGNIVDNCTETGPECIPLIIENAPVGSATFRLPVNNIPAAAYPDYDVYFDGVTSGWIQYPN